MYKNTKQIPSKIWVIGRADDSKRRASVDADRCKTCRKVVQVRKVAEQACDMVWGVVAKIA